MPSRSSARSSAITTRTGPPHTGRWGRRRARRWPACRRARPGACAGRRARGRRGWRRRRPSSRTSMRRRPFSRHSAHLGAARLGVLDRVGQRLGDGEVGGELDRRGQAPVEVDLDGGRAATCAPRARRSPRPGRARTAAPGGCRARGRAARPSRSRASPRAFSTSSRAPSGSRSKRSSAMPRSSASGDEARLRAVVQVALDALQLGGGGVDRAGARLGQDLDALLELPAAGAEHDPRERAAGGRRAAHERGGQRAAGGCRSPWPGRRCPTSRPGRGRARSGRILGQRPPPGGHRDQPERGRPRGDRDREVGDADRQQQQVPGRGPSTSTGPRRAP